MIAENTNQPGPVWNWQWVPQQARCCWFVQRGGVTKFDRGFRSKQDASNWIDNQRLAWRTGFTFRLRGDDVDMHIVDRGGRIATT